MLLSNKRKNALSDMECLTEYIKNLENELEKLKLPLITSQPKVSIIIPVYNTEKYLKKCLLSIVQQTLKEIEIILVNDGSTDDSAKILSCFAKFDNRIKIINQENKKQGAARNNGVSNANGEYIGYVDSDDWVDLDYYEKLYNTAKKYDSDIALATNIRIGNGKTKKRLNLKDEKEYISLNDKIKVSNQFKNECPTNKIYKKDLLTKYNIIWPEGIYCEDKLYTIKALFYSNKLATTPNTYYYYYRRKNSTVNNKCSVTVSDKELAKKQVIDFLRNNNANIKDKTIWATVSKTKIANFTIYSNKESLKTKALFLFGLIPVKFEKI